MMTNCNPIRSTRSSHKVNLLVVPHQKSNKLSEKAFAVTGPSLWNKLLTDKLRGCNSVDTFKKKLKTMLFFLRRFSKYIYNCTLFTKGRDKNIRKNNTLKKRREKEEDDNHF